MADGTFAVLTLALGLLDMGANYCPTGSCLGPNTTDSRMSFSLGETYFQDESYGTEFYVRRDTALAYGPFQVTYGLSLTDTNDAWVGVGQSWDTTFGAGYLELHAMPGIYIQGDGIDLGGPVEFRSGIELGYEARNGMRFGLGYDHRSNAGLYGSNMGLETVHLRVSMPTN